jgi:endoglycosylceramidase
MKHCTTSFRLAIAALIATVGAFALSETAVASAPHGPFTAVGKWMVDSQGRVVVMHGFDVVRKSTPYYPSGFGAADAKFLAGEGVSTARIGFIWAGVEPQPGVYDDVYIHHVIAFARLLEHYGIHPLVDFHQDGYGTSDITPEAECSAHSLCWIGSGDGAPKWAQLGTSSDSDFQHFWDNDPASDGVGIQTHLIKAWKHVAVILDRSRASAGLLGLDPLNEPYPGTGYAAPCGDFSPCPAFEQTQLYDFYNRVIAALRSAGDEHVIFPEGIAQNAQAEPSLPAFGDPQTGFNWHYYCTESQLIPDATGVVSGQFCPSTDASAHANILKYTSALGVPWLVSEFGGNDADAEYANEVDWMDGNFLSWMEWMYYQAATDAANLPGQGLLTVDSLGGSEANANQDKLNALIVPYAQAIAGTPESYSFDRSSKTMTLSYLAQPVPGAELASDALTRIFVPSRQYPLGYQLTVKNGHEETANGQWVQVAADQPGEEVKVTISSAAPPVGG